MRPVHANRATATASRATGGAAARRPPAALGFVHGLLGFALAVSAAGCASSGTPEAAPEAASEAAGPAAETPATVGEAAAPQTTPSAPAPATSPPAEGIFTEGQADRGRTAFDEVCSDCHTTSEFRGRTFQSNWGRRTVYSFFRTIRSTMPDDNPGGLEEETYLDVVSYILSINGHAAGGAEMTAESPMRQVRMAPPASSPRTGLARGIHR